MLGPRSGSNQVGPGTQAVGVKGLPEIGVVTLETEEISDVEQAEDSDRGVDNKAPGGDRGAADLELQEVVDQNHRAPQVEEEALYRLLCDPGRNEPVDRRDGPQNENIDAVVEREHHPIEPLDGVADRLDPAVEGDPLNALDRRRLRARRDPGHGIEARRERPPCTGEDRPGEARKRGHRLGDDGIAKLGRGAHRRGHDGPGSTPGWRRCRR